MVRVRLWFRVRLGLWFGLWLRSCISLNSTIVAYAIKMNHSVEKVFSCVNNDVPNVKTLAPQATQ